MSREATVRLAAERSVIRVGDERRSRVHRWMPEKFPPLASQRPGLRETVRITARLRNGITRGVYVPAPGYMATCPKRGGGLRRVLLLTREDRMVYEALVRPACRTLETAHCAPDVLFGPRGDDPVLRWSSFLYSPLRAPGRFVVVADIAAAGVSVEHRSVEEALTIAGVGREVRDGVLAFLGLITGGEAGLPDDVAASEYLESAVLARVDRRLVADGWHYTRCSDDVRITVDSAAQAEAALTALTEGVADVGLRLQDRKTLVVERGRYEATLALRRADWLWERAAAWRGGRLVTSPPVTFLRQRMLVVRSSRRARCRSVEAIVRVGSDLPGDDRMSERAVEEALAVLAAARDPAALDHLLEVMLRLPAVSAVVVSYLRSLLPTRAGTAAVEFTDGALRAPLHPVQRAWLYRAVVGAPPRWLAGLLDNAREAASSVGADWVLRTEAARLLASAGELNRHAAWGLAAQAPPQFAPEIVGFLRGRGTTRAAGA